MSARANRHRLHRPSPKDRYVPARFIEEYLEVLTGAQEFQTSNLRNWSLLSCYAELQFKLNGGSKCPLCRSAVRHVVPVIAEREDGSTQEFPCLCTRCFEGERAVSKRLIQQVGEARVEYPPRVYGAESGKTVRFDKKFTYSPRTWAS